MSFRTHLDSLNLTNAQLVEIATKLGGKIPGGGRYRTLGQGREAVHGLALDRAEQWQELRSNERRRCGEAGGDLDLYPWTEIDDSLNVAAQHVIAHPEWIMRHLGGQTSEWRKPGASTEEQLMKAVDAYHAGNGEVGAAVALLTEPKAGATIPNYPEFVKQVSSAYGISEPISVGYDYAEGEQRIAAYAVADAQGVADAGFYTQPIKYTPDMSKGLTKRQRRANRRKIRKARRAGYRGSLYLRVDSEHAATLADAQTARSRFRAQERVHGGAR